MFGVGIIISLLSSIIGTVFWIVFIVWIIRMARSRKISSDPSGLTNQEIATKINAYEEVYNKCKVMSDSGEVTYFSLEDIRTIVDKLEEL